MNFNLDLFNNGVAVDNNSYDNSQFNATGKPLSPTKPDNGQPIATDYSNDNRTAWDYKTQARQAQLDTMPAYDTKNKIVMKDGYLIDKAEDSRNAELSKAAESYLEAYFDSNGDVGHAALAASKGMKAHRDLVKRQAMIPQLEATGRYQSMDLEKWAQTGNTQDLLTNAGKWQNMGQGIETNTLTGESRQIPGYQQPQPNLHYLKNEDGTYTAVNPKTNEVVGGNVGTPKATPVTGASGGGIGLDDEEAGNPAFKDDGQGGLLKLVGTNKDGSPRYVAANSKDIATHNEQAQAGTPDANTQLVTSDLDTLSNLSDEEINQFTGHLISKNETAQSAFAEAQGPKAQANLAASKRVSTQMGNSAIAAAKAAGASGINTEAEIKRFTAGVPQVRYTSVADYKASLQEIKQYAENFKQELIRTKGGKANAGNSNAQLSDDDLLKKYGG